MPVETIEDTCIKIKATKKIAEFVSAEVKSSAEAPAAISMLRTSTTEHEGVLLKLEDLNWLNKYLEEYRRETSSKIYLHELLLDADIRLPRPKVTPRNPELEARIQKLTAEQNARDYAAMTKNVDNIRKGHPEDTIAYQMKQINKQLIAVAQFVFSVIAGFVFGFVGVELIIGNLDFGFRLLLGIICALVIALAEIYFLAIKLNEDVDVFVPASKNKLHQE